MNLCQLFAKILCIFCGRAVIKEVGHLKLRKQFSLTRDKYLQQIIMFDI